MLSSQNIIFKYFALVVMVLILTNCGGLSKTDARKVPINAQERARKNVEEGRGARLEGILGNKRTTYEFSTSNSMWRASLEILDFLPMTTVDYAGGIIISDWYTDGSSSSNESIKISVRFLSNEVRSDSLKITVHKKVCNTNNNCNIQILNNTTIGKELRSSIIRDAALLEKEKKSKKK